MVGAGSLGVRCPSPLVYPGGKSRILRALLRHIPSSLTELVSPFVGGGALELTLARVGVRVIAYDAWEHLVCFWTEFLRHPSAVAAHVRRHAPVVGKKTYLRFRDELRRGPDFEIPAIERAARFYIVNRCCFRGLTRRGGCAKSAALARRQVIEQLATAVAPPTMTVECATFEQSIPRHPEAFLFCDPPYVASEGVYPGSGQRFDHQALATLLLGRNGPWMLTYGDCPLVRGLYDVPGVRMIPIVYRGHTRASQRGGRRDLVLVRGPQ